MAKLSDCFGTANVTNSEICGSKSIETNALRCHDKDLNGQRFDFPFAVVRVWLSLHHFPLWAQVGMMSWRDKIFLKKVWFCGWLGVNVRCH